MIREKQARSIVLGVVLLGALTRAASAADIVVADGNAQPESLAAGPGGVLYVGSANSPFVHRIRAGATTSEPFVNVSDQGPGTFFLGMLVDAAANTLWTCQLAPVPGTTPPQRRSSLRGFDLANGAAKLRWDLPGETNVCNDFVVGPDKALYITDTGNGKIFRLAAGASAAELFFEDRANLIGIDGITFLNNTLYVNNVRSGKVYRVPVSGGKAGAAVEIVLDQALRGPDGMRAASGKLIVAENGAGRISAITVDGDKGTVVVLKDELWTPTAVEPAGDVIWIAERASGKAVSIPLPR